MEKGKEKFTTDDALARAAVLAGGANPNEGNPPNAVTIDPPATPGAPVESAKVIEAAAGGAPPATEPAKPSEDSASATIKLEDVFGLLKEKYQIASEADLSEMLTRANKLKEVEDNTQKLKQELEGLRAKSEISPFADPYIEKLNALYSANAPKDQIKAFTKLYELGDVQGMSELEVRKMALQLREGYTAQEAEIYVKKHYTLDEDDFSEDEVTLAKAALRKDARTDRDFLVSQLDELSKAPAQKLEDAEQNRVKDYVGKLEKVLPTLTEGLKSVAGVPLSTKQGEEFTFDFPIPENQLAQAAEFAKSYAVANQIPLTEEGMKDINEFLKTTFIAANATQYLQTAYEQGKANKEKEMLAKYHIPGYVAGATKGVAPERTDEFASWKKQNAERPRR